MRKHLRLVFAIALLAIIGLLVHSVLTPREPVYQGKPLSDWLEGYISRDGHIIVRRNAETDEAVRHIGTNAIPRLLQMLRAHDSIVNILPVILAHTLSARQTDLPPSLLGASVILEQAAFAFEALGASASNAVPQLLQIYRDNVSAESQSQCLYVLRSIGPSAKQAIPTLLETVTSAPSALPLAAWRLRLEVIETLGKIHSEPGLVVPVLVKSLQDLDCQERSLSADSLAEFGPEAKSAVPALLKLLNDPNPWARIAATNALKAIDPAAAAKAGVK